MSLVGKMGDEGGQKVGYSEILEIPENHFINKVDLDCDEPYCMAVKEMMEGSVSGVKILIPKALAYYLRTHFCGSKNMHDSLIEQGKHTIRTKIKLTLDIG